MVLRCLLQTLDKYPPPLLNYRDPNIKALERRELLSHGSTGGCKGYLLQECS